MPSKPVREHVSERTRADLLNEIAGLPPTAFVNTLSAAAYIGTTPAVMQNWRAQRRGPRYHGAREFIRYKIGDLDRWMSTRADEIRPEEQAAEPPLQPQFHT